MTSQPEDVNSIVSGKLALKYAGPDIEAMKAVAKAYSNRSLQEFEAAKSTYKSGNFLFNIMHIVFCCTKVISEFQ